MPCKISASQIVASHLRCFVFALFCAALLLGSASAQESASVANPTVPNLVKFSGTIAATPAGSVGVIFALYAEQTGGAPLWQEVQNVSIDGSGHYTSLLGSSTAAGIPLEVFSSNEARWLGVQVQGQAEQARVLLVSVPYALKAADAQTLGGLPPSAFLRADGATVAAPTATAPTTASTAYINTAAVNAASTAVANATTITAGTLPVFTNSSGSLGNSLVSQVATSPGAAGNFVGINSPYAPAATLDVVDTNPTVRVDNYTGVTSGSGNSPNFNFITANGTATAPLATQNGDNLGQFAATGYNGSAFPGSKAKVTFVATDNWTPTDNGTAMSFQTTANGTVMRTSRIFIDNTGNVGIGSNFGVSPAATPPPYPLTVNGIIQSTSGGYMFPDGSTLASASTVPSTGSGNTFTGNQTVTGNEQVSGSLSAGIISAADLNTDQSGFNNGSGTSYGIHFGPSGDHGQGIASNRTTAANGNTFGLDFYTNNAKRMSITQGGNVGIGTAAPAQALSVVGAVGATSDVNVDSANNNNGSNISPGLRFGTLSGEGIASNRSGGGPLTNLDGLDFYTNGARQMYITHGGQVGIGTSTPATFGAQLAVSTSSEAHGIVSIVQGLSGMGQANLVGGSVWGDTAGEPGYYAGILGTADENIAGYFANYGDGPALYAENDVPSPSNALVFQTYGYNVGGECGIDVSGNLTCDGKVISVVAVAGGSQKVALYSVQSTENWFEDAGSGQLSNGSAQVALDSTFAQTVNTGAEYHVFLTPNGDCKGLYVARKSASSFEVHELGGGHSSIAFDYRIMAKRVGYESVRLEDLTEQFKKQEEQHKKMHPARPSGGSKVAPAATAELRNAAQPMATQPK